MGIREELKNSIQIQLADRNILVGKKVIDWIVDYVIDNLMVDLEMKFKTLFAVNGYKGALPTILNRIKKDWSR